MKNRTQLSMSEARKHYSVCMAHRSQGTGRVAKLRHNQPLAAAFSCMADQQTHEQQQRRAILAAASRHADDQTKGQP
jgi:hypothetical protein